VDPNGSLVFADQANYRLRRVDASGKLQTIAGAGIPGSLGDGDAGTSAQIGLVTGLAIDGAGNIYFADGTYVRELTSTGVMKRIAGAASAGSGSSGDGGPALAATFLFAGALTVDGAGNIYCSDNGLIRRIAADGTISTVAGTRTTNSPVHDGTAATSGSLSTATALATDSSGNLLLGASGLLRRVDVKTGIITTLAGNTDQSAPSQGAALSVFLGSVFGIVADPNGTIWLAASAYPTNRVMTLANGIVITIASTPAFVDPPDGVKATAVALSPASIAVSRSGDLYVGETATCSVRKIGADGILSTVPGTGNCNSTPRIVPVSLAADSRGNVYVSDAVSGVLSISPSGTVSTVPGLPGGYLAMDSQNRLYVNARLSVLRLTAGGTVETVVPATTVLSGQIVIALDSADNLYLAVSAPNLLQPAKLYRVDSGGAVTPIAGSYPDRANGLAVDGKGDFWMTDYAFFLYGIGPGLSFAGYPGGWPTDGPLLSSGIDTLMGGRSNLQSGADGSIYIVQSVCNCVRKITGAPPAAAPVVTAGGVVNAASLSGGVIAPGELISIFGTNLGPAALGTFTLANNSIPTALGDVEVLVNDAPVPVTAVSAGQINAFVPYTIAGSKSATLTVNAHGAPSVALTIAVGDSAFGLFSADGSGAGQGAILNQDGSYNSVANPAAAGSVVSLFGTGEGGITPSSPAGGLVFSTPFPLIAQAVSVTIGGKAAFISYAGAAPFLPAGVDQINVAIPAGTPSGPAAVAVTIGQLTTKIVTVAVK
jgi:uncharacterized protein (TIGR03437 family)